LCGRVGERAGFFTAPKSGHQSRGETLEFLRSAAAVQWLFCLSNQYHNRDLTINILNRRNVLRMSERNSSPDRLDVARMVLALPLEHAGERAAVARPLDHQLERALLVPHGREDTDLGDRAWPISLRIRSFRLEALVPRHELRGQLRIMTPYSPICFHRCRVMAWLDRRAGPAPARDMGLQRMSPACHPGPPMLPRDVEPRET
jgi:hypothetical protein